MLGQSITDVDNKEKLAIEVYRGFQKHVRTIYGV